MPQNKKSKKNSETGTNFEYLTITPYQTGPAQFTPEITHKNITNNYIGLNIPVSSTTYKVLIKGKSNQYHCFPNCSFGFSYSSGNITKAKLITSEDQKSLLPFIIPRSTQEFHLEFLTPPPVDKCYASKFHIFFDKIKTNEDQIIHDFNSINNIEKNITDWTFVSHKLDDYSPVLIRSFRELYYGGKPNPDWKTFEEESKKINKDLIKIFPEENVYKKNPPKSKRWNKKINKN